MKWRGLDEAQSGLGHPTLKAAHDERRALMQGYVPADTQDLNRRAVEELRASGIAERILPIGATASKFELPDQDEKLVVSDTLLASGPLILIFFRGRWCPFCVATLEAWNELLPQVRTGGANLLGISPQTVHQSYLMQEQHKLGFPLLSDAGNSLARQFGLVYRVPSYQQEIYARIFVNLAFINGDSSWELPLPAAYVIVQDRSVRYARADPDYTLRAEPQHILEQLKR